MATSPESRFWRHVAKGDTCWLWTAGRSGGYRADKRYGVISVRDASGVRKVYAHRLSWEMANGPIPDGLWVLHRCDTPLCVRPDHLFPGTRLDNVADMDAKGRRGYNPNQRCNLRGETHWKARLNPEKVELIRERLAAGERPESIAADYGVHRITISDIRDRRTWRHI